jgi:uncharacterized membrane protein
MGVPTGDAYKTRGLRERGGQARRAFSEFLGLPTAVIAAFLLLAAVIYAIDRYQGSWLFSLRTFLSRLVFRNHQATSDVLRVLAGSIITVTSITFSILPLAVQQAAGLFTSQVIDQFFRRKLNQVYFGFFVGLSLYLLLLLATVGPGFNPVIGATLGLLFTIAALYILVVLIYATINQVRPSVITEAIHNRAVKARERQLYLVHRTRRAPHLQSGMSAVVRAHRDGFVTDIDLETFSSAAGGTGGEAEIVLHPSIGSYVAFGDTLGEVRAGDSGAIPRLERALRDAVQLERERNLDRDPSYGIEQLLNIGWTTGSTSKHNPAAARIAILRLRDLLARWSSDPDAGRDGGEVAPVVYNDNVPETLLEALASMAIVSTESMQHQNYAEAMLAFAVMFERLPPDQQDRAEDHIRRLLPTLGDEVLSTELDRALADLVRALRSTGRFTTAESVQRARDELATTIGELESRSTRVQSAKQSSKPSGSHSGHGSDSQSGKAGQ